MLQSCSTSPSSASVLMPSARKGLTGPQLASVLQSQFDKDGKFDKEGRRCAAAQSHTLRVALSPTILTSRPLRHPVSLSLFALISTHVSPPLAAPESSQEIGPSHPALSCAAPTLREVGLLEAVG